MYDVIRMKFGILLDLKIEKVIVLLGHFDTYVMSRVPTSKITEL